MSFVPYHTISVIKLFKRSVLVKTFYDIDRYAFDLELLVRLREQGYRIIDSPVKVYKAYGNGSVSIKSIVYTFIDTLKIWIKKKKGLYGNSGGVNHHSY